MDEYNILVQKEATHGIPIAQYAEALHDHLTDVSVSLAKSREEELDKAPDADVITGKYIDEELLERAERLKLFACYSAGYEHLPLDKLKTMDVAVTNGSGIHAPNVAEQVLGNIIVFSRRLDEGWRRQQRRDWRRYRAGELSGSTVTIVGLGAIGQKIIEYLKPFPVKTIGVRYSPEKGGKADKVVGFDTPEFRSTIAETDYLVLCCPLTETTEHLVNKEILDMLPIDSVVINVSRGGTIDIDALVDAIQANGIRGAYLDVTEPEPLPQDHVLWSFENVLITPHMAGSTPEYYQRCAKILGRNLMKVTKTGRWSDLENQILTPKR